MRVGNRMTTEDGRTTDELAHEVALRMLGRNERKARLYFRFNFGYCNMEDSFAQRGWDVVRRERTSSWGSKLVRSCARHRPCTHQGLGNTLFLSEVFVKFAIGGSAFGVHPNKMAKCLTSLCKQEKMQGRQLLLQTSTGGTTTGPGSVRVSQVVLDEAGRGNSEAARRRPDALSGINSVELNSSVTDLAQALLVAKALPEKALVDALHVGVCAVHGINYLLTWNYRHIDNAVLSA